MAILDGAIQAVEEQIPVLVTVQEVATAPAFKSVYEWTQPFSAAMLLSPVGMCSSNIASLRLNASSNLVEPPQLEDIPGIDLSGNPAARLLPLLIAIAEQRNADVQLPLSRGSSLAISIDVGCQARQSES